MTIQITDSAIAMWQVELDGKGNVIAYLSRGADGRLRAIYRFRWYRDDVIGPESKDVRRWYEMKISSTDDESMVLAKLRSVFERLRENYTGATGWEVLRGNRSLEEFTDAISAMPGMHTRVEARP